MRASCGSTLVRALQTALRVLVNWGEPRRSGNLPSNEARLGGTVDRVGEEGRKQVPVAEEEGKASPAQGPAKVCREWMGRFRRRVRGMRNSLLTPFWSPPSPWCSAVEHRELLVTQPSLRCVFCAPQKQVVVRKRTRVVH